MISIQRKKGHLLVKIWVVGLFGGMDLAYRAIFGYEDLSSFAHTQQHMQSLAAPVIVAVLRQSHYKT